MSHDTLTVFSIYDAKSESWSRPVFSRNVATVQRELRDLMAQGQHHYALHPEDYTLFKVGVWSEFRPVIAYDQAPEAIGTLIQYVPRHDAVQPVNLAA